MAAVQTSPSQVEVFIAKEDLPSPNYDSGVALSSEDSSPTTEVAPAIGADPVKPQVAETALNGNVATGTTPHSTGNGPDEVIPAENLVTWTRDQPCRLRMSDTGPLSDKPTSVMTAFERTVKRVPDHTAMAYKPDPKGPWKKWTYKQYWDDVRIAAKAFIKLGLEQYHGVAIIGFNSPQWFLSDLGAIFAGGFAAGVYTTNTPEACHYVLESCEANICTVENDAQLQKILKVRDRLPHLKAIIQWQGELKEKYPNCYTWSEFMELGKDVPEESLQARIKAQAPNKCCTLIYTSGTTGNPKGVMLSHDNLTWTSTVSTQLSKLRYGKEIGLSYLPLSHIAAQVLDIYTPLLNAAAVYFAQPDALKGTLGVTLKEVRPTIFMGVPRVWEKMQEKMQEISKSVVGMKKKIAIWAKGVGLRGNMSKMNGGSVPFGWGLANMLVFKKVRLGLGLDRCKYCLTGAAPISRETLNYFLSLDIPILELYGMSENTGPHTLSFPWAFRLSSVGKEIPGTSTKLVDADAEGNGEICMSGRHVSMGYLNMEEKTKETIDEEGWLHTGDVGKKDKDGFLYITGRIKELIITAGGENVAPVPIEDVVKEELPCISNCMLIGDKKKFLSILLTLKTEVNADTMMPLDKLSGPCIDWCRSVGSASVSVSQILEQKDERVLKAIQEGIDRANLKSTSRAQKIQKWSILPRDFSIPGNELGPTLKLKRPVVNTMYQNTIAAFYGE